ncbi:CRISPR-associated Cmr4 family protein [Oceanotoga teriensis]|jgi:CRISPR-associated protein Cmr4|uniref:CRISPR-associated Cmr4 family protein n=1 Tax=Oceanotoga teriensis TaxID=515440 RepID=A0AA45C7I0_9BACT|nr:type III-B CRISPR module RAMP protein Cmr4 [Oceanotoga teriensis]PWJ95334.1 CRISPR-associated Cmr4 family protein [Oceanotoga teriensis]
MFSTSKQLFIKTKSPLHAGIGRTIGNIDMPIQREKYGGYPKIEATTLKGNLRKYYENNDANNYFGKANNETVSVFGITDARLLFYPIKTIKGMYTYVTCSYLLNRFIEDNKIIEEIEGSKIFDVPENKCGIIKNNNQFSDLKDDYIYLDNFIFKKISIDNNKNKALEKFNFIKEKDIILLSDNDFNELIFLNKNIVHRNRVNEITGVVDKKSGSLYTEEYVPIETVFYTLILKNEFGENDLYEKFFEEIPLKIQIGSNYNFGKGIVEIIKK